MIEAKWDVEHYLPDPLALLHVVLGGFLQGEGLVNYRPELVLTVLKLLLRAGRGTLCQPSLE